MSLKGKLQYFTSNWKTTVQSVLTSVMVLSGVAVAPNPWISTALAGKILGAGAIAKIILGSLQSDGITLPAGSNVKQVTTVTTPKETA